MVMGTALATMNAAPVQAQAPPAVNQISRYCSACWRNARLPEDRWNDCTQEVFRRLLERVPVAGWEQVLDAESQERREFIRAIDAVKKQSQRDRNRYHTTTGEFAPPTSPNGAVRDDRDAVDQASRNLLTDRQQKILRLSMEGGSVADIAKELRLPPERVSDEKYKAIQKLRVHFQVN
jgi:RNA polymerase sigma factor (sigma-70 family)